MGHIGSDFWEGAPCMYKHQETCMDPEGGQGVWTLPPPSPLKNHKAIGFLSNTGPDPLNTHKATCTKPAFNVGPNIGRPAKHHLNGVSLVGQ